MKHWLYIWVLLPSIVWRSEASQPTTGLRLAAQDLFAKQSYSAPAILTVETHFNAVGDPLPVLATLAKDTNSEVRMIAAQLVAQLRIAAGASLLWNLLQDDNEAVRMSAVWALGRLHESTPVVPDVSGLKNPRANVRRLTAETLARLRNPAVETDLINTLSDPDDLVRWQTVVALGSCGSPRAIPALSLRLQDSSARVRRTAVGVLAQLGGATVVTPLLATLDDADWQTRAAAANALAVLVQKLQADRTSTADTILAKLKPDDFALIFALQKLGLANDERVLGSLVRALTGNDRGLAAYAMQAVVSLRITPILPLLAAASHHTNPNVRQRVVEIFGKLGGSNEVAALITALSDPVAGVQLTATIALCQLRQYVQPERLTEKLWHADPHVRAAAVRFFGEFGDRRFANQIATLIFDENRFVRSAAIDALEKFDDRSAIGPLLEVLTRQTSGGEPTGQRQAAGRGIVVGSNRSLPPLMSGFELLAQKAEAIKVLGDWRASEAVIPIIENGLQTQQSQLLATAAFALGQIGDRRALGPLITLVQDFYAAAPFETESPNQLTISDQTTSRMLHQEYALQCNARRTVIWALGRLGDSAAIPTLRQALNDRDSTVREAAAEALGHFAVGSQLFAAAAVRLPSLTPYLTSFTGSVATAE